MRYALISDIHANLPALEAVLTDTAGQTGVTGIYHLGDLVGYAPWPDETVALIEQSAIPGVAGNYDSTVATDYKHCGCRYEDPEQEALSHVSYGWIRAHVSSATKRFLGSLPFRIDILPNGDIWPAPGSCLCTGPQRSTRCTGPRIAPRISA